MMIRVAAVVLFWLSILVLVQAQQSTPVGPVPPAGLFTTTGVLKGNGSGTISQGACSDISNAAASCSTDATNASNIASGTLNNARLPAGGPGVIASLRGANFNTTADQAIAIPSRITAFQITGIVVTNCSTSLTLAAGGIYPTTSKGGTAIVAAIQVYTALTGATLLLPLTVAATPLATRYAVSNVYLSLTTGQGGAATCDVYVLGTDLT